MQVQKRDGTLHEVSFDKVTNRLKVLCNRSPKLTYIDPIEIAQKVCSQIYNGISTTKLDELAAEICIANITKHLEYGALSSRLIISNNHKLTSETFSDAIEILFNHADSVGTQVPLVSKELYDVVSNHARVINNEINHERDYDFDFFSFKTLEKAYLFKSKGIIVERIQYLFMRVALGFHGSDLDRVFETYHTMSQKYFIHATPTLFHAGTPRPQLLSCFLLGMEDSVEGIYKTLSDCAMISKWAGGIGVWAHDIRGNKSMIRSTNGTSNGIFPMLRVFNDTARHINQSGKRPGAFAIYLENWHTDILEFIEGKKNHGDEHVRARDLFYALWISDLFMERLKKNEEWTLFCPDESGDLSNYYGDEFKQRYEALEKNPNIRKTTIRAKDLWKKILIAQIETGTPYILYKDSANRKTNQSNIGTIKSSNLCCEIMEYSDHEQYACCTLGSLGLSRFIRDYDFNQIDYIDMYSIDNCKYCTLAKSYIVSNAITLNVKNVNNDDTYEQELDVLTKTHNIDDIKYPQIFIKYKDSAEIHRIGGLSELLTQFKPTYDFKKLYEVTKILTRNLNTIVDINYYPIPETRYSNVLHRPLGIGVQGLADVYCKMKIGFDSPEAFELNKQIFAVIYYSSVEESMELSKERKEGMLRIKTLRKQFNMRHFTKANEYYSKDNDVFIWKTGCPNIRHVIDDQSDWPPPKHSRRHAEWEELKELEKKYKPIDEELKLKDKYIGSYSSFIGSKLQQGQFQFDLWNKKPLDAANDVVLDWSTLRKNISQHGVRNSLLVAPMPTASTSQILGNNECIEPYTSNIYYRNTVAGSFIIMNKYVLDDLTKLGLWSDELKNEIILNGGSIQKCASIPTELKKIYKTSWDLSQKVLIDQSADRGIYICQSQSLNLFVEDPTINKLSSMHMYSWSKGLKTGMYYLRTKAAAKAQQFTIEPTREEACEMCSG